MSDVPRRTDIRIWLGCCMYMHKSDRSTLQVTQLAQTIHRNPNLVPIERHGEMPVMVSCEHEKDELAAVSAAIDAFGNSSHNSLGVICKTQKQAEWLHEALGKLGGDIHLLDARSTTFSNGVMIATAYLAKGLEFDQVFVPFCNEAEYHSETDRHMLYVGCTRAMHSLMFTHTGKPSPFLESALKQSLLAQRFGEKRSGR